MLAKKIFERETGKLIVKNPKLAWVGRVSLLFVFLLVFTFVVVVCLFFLVDFSF